MIKDRLEIADEDRWNVEALFPSLANWKSSLQKWSPDVNNDWMKQLLSYRGKLGDGEKSLKEFLDLFFSVERNLSKLYVYAHLRHDEEITFDDHKSAFGQIVSYLHEFHHKLSWFEPELLSLPEETIETYLKSPLLAEYHFYLEKIFRLKKHTLSPDKEALMALAGQALQTSQKAFSALNDADFKFQDVVDKAGQKKPLTHGLYSLYIRDQDRVLRENTFKNYFGKYGEFQNTLCELIQGEMHKHFFQAKARQYSNCLEAALYPKNIKPEAYHALINTVEENINPLHKYIALRKKVLNLPSLHVYDLQVPLTKDIDIHMPYQEAEEVVIESVEPLGSSYQNLLRKGLKDQRWVDRYENKNKRSGGYSSGCYDSFPYILMNYRGLLRDVFTLAHEIGHSMHSLLSNTHQPYQYSDYSIFLAEVASTFNEELLLQLLLERAKNKDEKIFLINQKIEDIRGTLFRQTLFAEFELFTHTMTEQGIPLTPKLLNEKYHELTQKYYGPHLVLDELAHVEWGRIPHFYYNYYVFQYATGISAALALVDRVKNGGAKERDDYLAFLSGGSSRYPIEMLQMAGVDMTTSEPVKATIQKFDSLVNSLEELLL